jgi:DNA-binding LacI/PurR family transcriptional regulator
LINRKIGKISRHLMYREVADRIQELIKTEGLGGQYLAPERELARLFEVSRETIRRGLSLLEKENIVKRHHGQGTQVCDYQQAQKTSDTKRILIGAYHSGQGSTGYVSDMVSGLTASAGNAGWLLSFCNLMMPESRDKFFSQIDSEEVDGVMLMSLTDGKLIEKLLGIWTGPAVLVDHYFEELDLCGVIDDSQGGARLAVDHLISLGHRRIGFVGISRREKNPWRYQGYISGLENAGIEIDEKIMVSCFGSFEGGREAGDELFRLDDPPTAIMAFDDTRAWGVWRAAEDHNLEVGKDIALIGFGDQAARAGFGEDLLTSVNFDGRQMGRVAVEKLQEQILNKSRSSDLIKVPTKLVIRQSTRNAVLGPPGK